VVTAPVRHRRECDALQRADTSPGHVHPNGAGA
jgi:hypothetical protein